MPSARQWPRRFGEYSPSSCYARRGARCRGERSAVPGPPARKQMKRPEWNGLCGRRGKHATHGAYFSFMPTVRATLNASARSRLSRQSIDCVRNTLTRVSASPSFRCARRKRGPSSMAMPCAAYWVPHHLQGKWSAHLVHYADDLVVMLNGIPLRFHRLNLPGS